MTVKTIYDIKPGESARLSKTILESDVTGFAELTGDHNPVHLDPVFAANTLFGQRVAHGIMSAALISAVLGTRLPGPGAVYLSQNLRFLKPVFLGDTITARVDVREVFTEKKRVVMATSCSNQHGDTIAEGESVLLIPAPGQHQQNMEVNNTHHK
jgi:3-hydroxybutyryl-CoA dehydratase